MNLSMIPKVLLEKLGKEIFSKSDIQLYIEFLINDLELNNYYENTIYDNNRNGICSKYNYESKNIYVCYEEMLNENENLYKNNSIDLILFTNLNIILSVLHEIVHVYQNACLHELYFPIYHVYEKELLLTESLDIKTYNLYYKYFIFEREAETIALENVLVIIRRYVPNAEIFYYYIGLLKKTIIRGYEFRDKSFYSPLKVIYEDLLKDETPTIYIPDTYDSLKLGVDVSIRQYKLFKKNYQRIIIDKNHLQIK